MRFAIVGAGALGSILGAHLARAGHDVIMVAREDRARRIREAGLRIKGLVEITAHCEAITEAAQLSKADALIVAVKTHATDAAIQPLANRDVDVAFSVQNGVMKNEQLARVFGVGRVLGAMADISGEMDETGHVVFTRNVNLYIGELDGRDSARVRQIAEVIASAGVRTTAVTNIQTIEWSKFVGWMGLMAIAVLTRVETWKFLTDPGSALAVVRVTRDSGALASALGIPLIDNSPLPVASICASLECEAVQTLQAIGVEFRSRTPFHRVSSLQDLESGRRLEIEETLGFAVRKAAEINLHVPTLKLCYDLVAALDRIEVARSEDTFSRPKTPGGINE